MAADQQIWGGSSTVGSATVEITGGTAVAVYGGGWAGSSSQDNVTGAATVSLSGNAKVSGGGLRRGIYRKRRYIHGGSKTVTVGGGVKIGGGTAKGVVINGGSPTEVKTGVDSFAIDPDLTGADGSVNVQLPARYDITSNPTITTGAVEADLQKSRWWAAARRARKPILKTMRSRCGKELYGDSWNPAANGTVSASPTSATAGTEVTPDSQPGQWLSTGGPHRL